MKQRAEFLPVAWDPVADLLSFALSFTAGPQSDESRIDFIAYDCFSWAYKSSFRISGWENMVNRLSGIPVPMLLGEYGAVVGKQRIWEEVECLYSPDMTGVFSGGCLYTYYEHRNGYGIVEVDDKGRLQKKAEFGIVKQRFKTVNSRESEEVYGQNQIKDYESWEGEYPARRENLWYATSRLLDFPGGWNQ